jgi:hypothetical protein
VSKKITENDLARFALALREDFETHDLPMEIRYSLASAISFRIAALIDKKKPEARYMKVSTWSSISTSMNSRNPLNLQIIWLVSLRLFLTKGRRWN